MVDKIDEERWLELTEKTIERTGGFLDLASEVAERCRNVQPSAAGLRILTRLPGHGEELDQHYVDCIGVEALRVAADNGLHDESFVQLQEHLIQRGNHGAAEL
ncbi:MAG: hypothetical protein ACRC0L_04440 [Angustibacter sp.]